MWMGNGKLKSNPDKAEFILMGNDQIKNSLKLSFPVYLRGKIMEPAISVKNLRVTLDVDNSLQRNRANLCLSCYHLQKLQRAHSYLTYQTAVKVANALISSLLDYCNLLL